MDAAAKKLQKKQERLKKKAKAVAKKQSKQPTEPAQKAAQQPPRDAAIAKKAKSDNGAVTTQKPKDVGFVYQGSEKFLTPEHPRFAELVSKSYQGFVHDPAASIDAAFHRIARKTFEMLRDKTYFQYDVVMAGGKNLSRTFVRRTLVGDPGITYKYLGLRIFAHSWTGPNVAPWFKQVHQLNQQLVSRTQRAMKRATNPMGSCDYNLTLINYMEPLTNWDLGLKEEETYGLGKTSVSWHADSSLKDFSAIAVYNCMMEDPHKKKKAAGGNKRKAVEAEEERDWRIALRLSPDGSVTEKTAASAKSKKGGKPAQSTPTKPPNFPPPVSMATKDGDAYYLLGDFNHDHQHMVLTGSTVRVSSTHRVAVDADSTLSSIQARIAAASDYSDIATVEGSPDARILTPQQVLKEQSALTELEMEWIRQYWLQGKQHDVLHADWQKPMRELEQVHWRRLEQRTKLVLDLVLYPETATDDWQASDRLKIVNVLLLELTLRQKRRGQFRQRMQDKVYRRIAPEFQPVERPRFTDASPLPYDLSPQLEALEALKLQLKTK